MIAGVGVAWTLAVALGLGQVWSYSATPGVSADAAVAAQADDALLAPGRPSVLVFFHPFCPCSQASLDALADLLRRHPDAAAALVFSDVRDGAETAADGELWRRADGLRRVVDRGGAIARRFDARTSGQAFVYAADGTLGYAGGLTAARGKKGGGVALVSADAVLAGRPPAARTADVFGCELN